MKSLSIKPFTKQHRITYDDLKQADLEELVAIIDRE